MECDCNLLYKKKMPRAPHQLKSGPVLTPHTSSGQMTWKLKGTDPSVTLGGQLLSRPLLSLHCSVMNVTGIFQMSMQVS